MRCVRPSVRRRRQSSRGLQWFKNLDKLIHYANIDGRVNVFYSTPSAYVAAVQVCVCVCARG